MNNNYHRHGQEVGPREALENERRRINLLPKHLRAHAEERVNAKARRLQAEINAWYRKQQKTAANRWPMYSRPIVF